MSLGEADDFDIDETDLLGCFNDVCLLDVLFALRCDDPYCSVLLEVVLEGPNFLEGFSGFDLVEDEFSFFA